MLLFPLSKQPGNEPIQARQTVRHLSRFFFQFLLFINTEINSSAGCSASLSKPSGNEPIQDRYADFPNVPVLQSCPAINPYSTNIQIFRIFLFFQSCPATNPAAKSGNGRQNTFKIKPLLLFLSPAFSSISSLLSLPYTIFLIYIFIKNLINKGISGHAGQLCPGNEPATIPATDA